MMKKKVKVFYIHPERIQLRWKKSLCKAVYAVLLTLIFGVLTGSKHMIPTSVKNGDPELIKKERFKTESVLQPISKEIRVRGGKVFKIPPTWNRYHTPWFYPPVVHLKTPKQSNHRYLYSPTRMMTSDGIGHSMGVINFEYNMALRLNLTYTHRVGFYSSLSMKDRYAVEDFFGWGYNEVQRKQLQDEGCESRNKTWPEDKNLYACHFCGKPRKKGKMAIKQVVNLPSAFGRSSCHSALCANSQLSFFRKHHRSHTIFQLNSDSCRPPVTDSNMLATKHLFYHKYWNRHGELLWPNPGVSSLRRNRIRFDPDYLNIAMHIRRGDFLEAETRKKRVLTKDLVFAEVLMSALSVVYRTEGPFSRMPPALHIYSEGKLLKDKVFSTHDVGVQDKAYYDIDGNQRDENWWKDLIIERFKASEDRTLENIIRSMRIYLHISENTITSLHEMIAADIFIGSVSGLSVTLVWSISRGVVLIPHQGSIDNERGKKGAICCSVPFRNDDGSFQLDLFETHWRAYVAATGDSVARAWLLAQRDSSARRKY